MGKFKPSHFQKDIYRFIKNDNKNALINAVAGSGKTTTLIEALRLINTDKRILFLAFNKSISTEIQDRVLKTNLKNVTVSTSHAYGFKTISNSLSDKLVLDKFKYTKLLTNILDFNINDVSNKFNQYNFNEEQMKLVQTIRPIFEKNEERIIFERELVRLCNLIRLTMCNNYESVINVGNKYGLILSDSEMQMSVSLCELGSSLRNVVDYTDMIYLPVKFNLETDKYDVVFIDECQDLNSAQRELMLMSINETGRFVAVGDKNQAIYGFAGADIESFDLLSQLPNTITLPLSECYRCGEEILEKIRYHVPQIKANKNNPKALFNPAASIKEIEDGDLIICRNTFPLVRLCLQLIIGGKNAKIIGVDVASSLIKMITETNENDMSRVFKKLDIKLKKIFDRIIKKRGVSVFRAKNNPEYASFDEKIQVIASIYSSLTSSNEIIDAKKVISVIVGIFSDAKGDITLTTIHRAKGLENERVFLIQPDILPSKYATAPWEILQEENLRYVAYTRAKSFLGIVTNYDAYTDFVPHNELNLGSEESSNDGVISSYIGNIGDTVNIVGEIIDMKFVSTYDSMVYNIIDANGNLFEKWGTISKKNIIGKNKTPRIGAKVKGNGKIVKHITYMDLKKNRISGL